jgi:hypothetical protein
MQVQCGACGKQMNLPASVAGKSVRCGCGQTLQVPAAAGSVAQQPTQRLPSTGRMVDGSESYWWLMTYIKINRVLGYVFLTLLVIGAFILVLGNIAALTTLFDLPVGEFLLTAFTLVLYFAAYVITGFVYLVIWFASADFLRAVVEIAENTRRIK